MDEQKGEKVDEVSPKVYFRKVTVVSLDNPRMLNIERPNNAPDPPDSMLVLWRAIQDTARAVATLFAHDTAKLKEFFEGLYIAAETGLVGRNYSLQIGWDNLKEARDRIADAFPAVRDRYWKFYFRSLLILLVFLPLGGTLYYASVRGLWGIPKPDAKGSFDLWIITFLAFFWIPVGASFGIFLEFIFSVDRQVPFDKLLTINPNRWHPFQQLINTVLVAWVFAFVMGTNFFQIGVASVLLNEFATTKPYLCLAVGFVTGFAFPYVRDIMYKLKPISQD
ncbi:MAG: hypothetical protein M3Z96_11380 [Pseudomonadota bacterium]|nr:hypothetical protein [Pseudomonadota bacterium]